MEHPNIRSTLNPATLDDKVKRALDYCANNNVRFVDQQFPPNQTSFAGNPAHPEYRGQWNSLGWARAEEIFGRGNYDIFRGISPTDIRQGALGDCYFLCSLASLAEQPSLITRLFDQQNVNQYGVLGVWLHIDGAWRQYVLDESFPVNPSKYELAFSRSVENELWVIALEKAYAKAYGSYFDIVGGDPVHALRDLTGAPYDRIEDFTDQKTAWNKLKDAHGKRFVITCFTRQGKSREEQGRDGLVYGHAYSILDVREVIDAYGAPRFILKIRNPWGRFEWNGDFSDDSPAWVPQIKEQLKVEKKDDGIFWMPFEEFIKHFEGIGIIKAVPGYVSNGTIVQQRSGNNKSILRLTVPREGDVTLSIDQLDARTVDNPKYQYSYFRMTLAKMGNNELELVDTVLSPERNVFLERRLAAGEYVLLVEAYWSTNLVSSFSVGSYGSVNLEIQALEANNALYNAAEFQAWKSFALRNSQNMERVNSRQAGNGAAAAQIDTFKFQSRKNGLTLYSFHNSSQTHTVHDVLKFLQLTGFDVAGRQANKQGADLLINPRSNDIVLFKMDPREKGFSLSHQVVQEELIPSPFQQDQYLFEVLSRLGGTQTTGKSADPTLVTREQQRLELERIAREKAQEEAARIKLIEEQARIAAENKRKQEEHLRQQGELYNRMNAGRADRVQDRSGLSGLISSIFGGFFAPEEPEEVSGFGLPEFLKGLSNRNAFAQNPAQANAYRNE